MPPQPVIEDSDARQWDCGPPLDDSGRRLLFTEARTANAFAPDPVDESILREIWELAKWPPTSANVNPMRILDVRSTDARQRLVPHLWERNRAKTMSAPGVAVLAVDTDFHEQVPRLVPYKPEIRDLLANDHGLREETAQMNAVLQAGYFIMAIRAVGLAAGPMVGFDAAAVDLEFLAGTAWHSFLVVNFGLPAEGAWLGRLPRLDYEDVVLTV